MAYSLELILLAEFFGMCTKSFLLDVTSLHVKLEVNAYADFLAKHESLSSFNNFLVWLLYFPWCPSCEFVL